MSDTYKEEKKDANKEPKEIFLGELSNKLEKFEHNVLYEDMYNFDNGIAEDTYK